MKRYFAAFLGSVAIASGAVLMGTQGLASNETSLSIAASTQTVKSSSKSIYYKNQADADVALAAFDKDNPSCQLWTNWQKMCSRTGDGGREITCTTDISRPVKPSVPFCTDADDNDIIDAVNAGNPARTPSSNRYCLRYRQIGEKDEYRCDKYSANRPFNGNNLAALRTPLCASWAQGGTGKLVCHEVGASNGVPSCADLTVTQQRKGPFYCAKVNNQDGIDYKDQIVGQCRDVGSPSFYKPHEGAQYTSGQDIVLKQYIYRDPNIHGLSCKNFKKGI